VTNVQFCPNQILDLRFAISDLNTENQEPSTALGARHNAITQNSTLDHSCRIRQRRLRRQLSRAGIVWSAGAWRSRQPATWTANVSDGNGGFFPSLYERSEGRDGLRRKCYRSGGSWQFRRRPVSRVNCCVVHHWADRRGETRVESASRSETSWDVCRKTSADGRFAAAVNRHSGSCSAVVLSADAYGVSRGDSRGVSGRAFSDIARSGAFRT